MTSRSAINRAMGQALGVRLVRVGRGPGTDGPAPSAAGFAAAREDAGLKTLTITAQTTDEIRPPAHQKADRLLDRPIFVLSSVRSGSTLLRLVLNAHSQLHAPHELHVRRLRVVPSTRLARKAMSLLGHNEGDLEHLLWDRVLHRELTLSGKQFIVDKTPSNSFVYHRIRTCWPDARFIFLLRHPASIAASWAEASRGRRTVWEARADALRYMRAVEKARSNLTGLTVRYEDLTADPLRTTQEICGFLGLPWEPAMLEYGQGQTFVKGVGDWSDKVRTGSIQPGRPLPAEADIPPRLVLMSRRWGYLPQVSPE